MIRTLKIVGAANLIIAILFVGGYIAYGLSNELPIDKYFLGSGPVGLNRYSIQKFSPWKYAAVVEFAILIAFVVGRLIHRDLIVVRVICLYFGVDGLWKLLFTSLLSTTYTGDDFAYLHVSRFDCILAFYVYCSHLFYALSGSNNA
jgi:fructose-specific phosphotransferase system IIC component